MGDPVDTAISERVDATGLKCPEPVMLLHAAIRRNSPGSTIMLLATDPSTERDVANFCRFLGHELVSTEHTEGHFRYIIRKAA